MLREAERLRKVTCKLSVAKQTEHPSPANARALREYPEKKNHHGPLSLLDCVSEGDLAFGRSYDWHSYDQCSGIS
jgi:hypothetical protein